MSINRNGQITKLPGQLLSGLLLAGRGNQQNLVITGLLENILRALGFPRTKIHLYWQSLIIEFGHHGLIFMLFFTPV
ncbi:hypothetical protein [Acinetobacter indicus]|uniref:hypothetical protein n=1 Tax=Acinetobacter indicus TaxID=756892 RepID=UPI001FA7CD6D|nr:hypothetical protein [Acinetobacter indicus]UNW03306.1 hypothetical protein MOW12_09195 [Acinetobacter indicus]